MNDLSDIKHQLTPKSILRVGINMANKLLVSGTDENGDPVGVSPDIGNSIAERLGVPVAFVPYASPGEVADAANRDEWDLANIGAEPERAKTIAFTDAYCEIEATYLVRSDAPFRQAADLDVPGCRIAVKARSAYCLWLQRNITRAELVLVDPAQDPFLSFESQQLDALAGLRTGLSKDLARFPQGRVLEGSFTSVQQAVGTPKKNSGALSWLQATISDLKASGQIRKFIDHHKVSGLTVAP
jgi:polar amino acid transport system substrate-binding protein